MASADDAGYRLRLADGFLEEARQDHGLGRWRSCVDNSQLAAENAGKAVLALIGPVGRSHKASELLAQSAGSFSAQFSTQLQRLIDLTKELGYDVHIASDYGDEDSRRTPWEMFDGTAAVRALSTAEAAVTIAQEIISHGP
jgi:HEPN domain-containing protein